MAVSNFLQLTNRVLKALNEVPLTSATFSTATGFYQEAQDAINMAIFDIYTWEDTEWPFLWASTTLQLVPGKTDYTRTDSFTALNWDSFAINRITPTVSSITCNLTTGIATVTTASAHNLITGDIISVWNCTDAGYNASAAITVTSTTQFTYQSSATSSPAVAVPAGNVNTPDGLSTSQSDGIIHILCENVLQTKLQLKAWDQYLGNSQKYRDGDLNTDPSGQGLPQYVVRKPDNNIYIGGPPANRYYTVYYEGFTIPASLSSQGDTPLVPQAFEQVIIDKALHYAYMFRSDLTSAQLAEQRYEQNIFKMRRILIPQETYCIATD